MYVATHFDYRRQKRLLILSFLLFWVCILHVTDLMAADDVIILKNGDKITGEIKKLVKADLHIDPGYGENVFIIDWAEVKNVQGVANFIVETSTRQRLVGVIKTDPASEDRIIIQTMFGPMSVSKSTIVYLDPMKKNFWGRLDLAFDFGLGLTAAKQAKKLNVRAKAGYTDEKWSTGIQYDTLYDIQTDSEAETESKIERSELRADYRRDISGKWFIPGFVDFLQSSELELKLRTTMGGGVGNYLVRNNRWLLSTSGGVNWTNEKYVDPATETKDSAEGYASVEFEIFNIGDLDIYSYYKITPSFSDLGRLRMDLKTDFSWELIEDLFFRIGFSTNYDNHPPEGVPHNDYVFDMAVGWSY